ncbi:MAG: hypothetical protein KGQ88_00785 [Chloroflexi bacterium]|nr:hypothetical protein [Chloroflexota bacterium]
MASMVTYVLGDPYLFIGSTTVMTTAMVLGAVVLAATAAVPFRRADPISRTAETLLDWAAPKLAIVLAYFGIGSMSLATEILIRYHGDNPVGTEIQFRSGVGHLAVALIGILLLSSRLRGHDLRRWLDAHFWALAYLSVQVLVFTPPWFDFQFQGALVFGIARGALVGALAVNLYLWLIVARAVRLPAPRR